MLPELPPGEPGALELPTIHEEVETRQQFVVVQLAPVDHPVYDQQVDQVEITALFEVQAVAAVAPE
jgi:hypothetical protein